MTVALLARGSSLASVCFMRTSMADHRSSVDEAVRPLRRHWLSLISKRLLCKSRLHRAVGWRGSPVASHSIAISPTPLLCGEKGVRADSGMVSPEL